MTTIVTALYDINREHKGDGRRIDDYLKWFKTTLQLNCNLFIVTELKFKEFIINNRPKEYKTHIVLQNIEKASYYKYRDRMIQILESKEYKDRIAHPERVECKLPEYNIIQYSKFGWLEEAIKVNPFNSEYFFWMDAGLSRFFYNCNLTNIFPSEQGMDLLYKSNKKFIIQQRQDMDNYIIDDNYIWRADNLFKGGIFGGHKEIIPIISNKLENIFISEMLNKNNVNNEQLALVLLWKKESYLFNRIPDIKRLPAVIFQLLSQ